MFGDGDGSKRGCSPRTGKNIYTYSQFNSILYCLFYTSSGGDSGVANGVSKCYSTSTSTSPWAPNVALVALVSLKLFLGASPPLLPFPHVAHKQRGPWINFLTASGALCSPSTLFLSRSLLARCCSPTPAVLADLGASEDNLSTSSPSLSSSHSRIPIIYAEMSSSVPQSQQGNLDRYCVIHVATTCDEHGVYVTKDSAEVIELGWILLDAKTCEEV